MKNETGWNEREKYMIFTCNNNVIALETKIKQYVRSLVKFTNARSFQVSCKFVSCKMHVFPILELYSVFFCFLEDVSERVAASERRVKVKVNSYCYWNVKRLYFQKHL